MFKCHVGYYQSGVGYCSIVTSCSRYCLSGNQWWVMVGLFFLPRPRSVNSIRKKWSTLFQQPWTSKEHKGPTSMNTQRTSFFFKNQWKPMVFHGTPRKINPKDNGHQQCSKVEVHELRWKSLKRILGLLVVYGPLCSGEVWVRAFLSLNFQFGSGFS